MLIDFTVENFRSIKEPVTLSAIAQTHKRNKLDDQITKPFSFPQRKLEILPVLGIFGANASGKSNVLNALDHLLSFVVDYDKFSEYFQPSSNYIKPFLLDLETSKSPTKFLLRVLIDGNIYIYQITTYLKNILEEKLEYIPRNLERTSTRLIFNRVWNDKTESYLIENGKEFGETYREIQSSLKKSHTFLGFLSDNLNNQFLLPMVVWLRLYQTSRFSNSDIIDQILSCVSLEKWNETLPELKNKVSKILKKFDVGIEAVEIEKTKKDLNDNYEIWIIHKTQKGNVKWLLEEESLGTKKLFSLATRLFLILETGGIMLVDELGASTHPHINREIIKLFQNSSINKKHAQLIFTSHDSSLLSKGLLRRDQTWFTQKREDGSTDLYSLSDYGVRNDLAVEKAYLDGRFNAVPFLPSEKEMEELVGVN